MIDREKILNGLDCCSDPEGSCRKCPYGHDLKTHELCMDVMASDTLALLNEQQETITSLQSTISELYALLDDVCKDFRERTEEDCVCGLCQYDGAYKGSSGDWCNECPGFESADCFTMKNEIRKMCGKDLLPEP